jgi:hypothetical protein
MLLSHSGRGCSMASLGCHLENHRLGYGYA